MITDCFPNLDFIWMSNLKVVWTFETLVMNIFQIITVLRFQKVLIVELLNLSLKFYELKVIEVLSIIDNITLRDHSSKNFKTFIEKVFQLKKVYFKWKEKSFLI